MNTETSQSGQQAVKVVSLGCRLNLCEAEQMEQHSEAFKCRDVVVVNTCAVTAEAVRQSRQTVRKLKRTHPGARIVVTGCASQIYPEQFAQMSEVSKVLDNSKKTDPSTWLALAREMSESNGAIKLDRDHQSVSDSAGMTQLATSQRSFETDQTVRNGSRVRAFVAVQNGCDHRCTFCIIPYGRGDSRSVPAGEVVRRVQEQIDFGRSEIVLTGVDLTAWGVDLPCQPKFGTLVQSILKHVSGLKRLRISSLDCAELDPQLLEAIADPRVMPHMHLSLQSGSDLILKRMKRRHLRAHAIETCHELRKARPNIAIGADLIAGFPTETEENFAESIALFDDCGLDFAHVFAFSARVGTPAARMPQLCKTIVKDRARQLRHTTDAAFARFTKKFVNKEISVLLERDDFGHSDHYAKVRFIGNVGGVSRRSGEVVRAEVIGRSSAHANELEAVFV